MSKETTPWQGQDPKPLKHYLCNDVLDLYNTLHPAFINFKISQVGLLT